MFVITHQMTHRINHYLMVRERKLAPARKPLNIIDLIVVMLMLIRLLPLMSSHHLMIQYQSVNHPRNQS